MPFSKLLLLYNKIITFSFYETKGRKETTKHSNFKNFIILLNVNIIEQA